MSIAETILPEVDVEMARRFLQLVDASDTFTFQTFHDRQKGTEEDGTLARVIPGPAGKELLSLHNRGAGVYFTVNRTDGAGRKGKNITNIRAVWQEDDDGVAVNFPIEPSLVVESSPGRFHRYWLLAEPWPADEHGRADHAAVMERMIETYGSDKNAKDLCRVLRVPGFLNRKHGDPHQVRVVSSPGWRYSRAEILAAFPPVERSQQSKAKTKTNGATPHSDPGRDDSDDQRIHDALFSIDASERHVWLTIGMAIEAHYGQAGRALWDEWSLTAKDKHNPADQDRVWRSFKGSGVTVGTLFHYARHGGWEDGTEKLYEEWCRKHRHSPPGDDGGTSPPSDPEELLSVCAKNVKMAAIEWLWPDRFAVGKLGILAGLPDEGKGQIFAFIIAMITTGGLWPCGEGRAPKGRVLLFTAEDDLGDTVVPRLAAAGADLSQVEIVQMVKPTGTKQQRMFSLITDLEMLRRKIIEMGDVRMVLIDPITAYLGVKQMDSFRTGDVRSVLGPVVLMAAELQVSFLGIMHFNKKTDVTNALLRISDSLAYGATARHVYAAIDDAENKRKLFVKAKNNLAKYDQQSLAYHFGSKTVGFDEKLKKEIWAPYIEWEPQPVVITATEAMESATSSRTPKALSSAMKFLEEFLADGWKYRDDVAEAAEANLISDHTLRRAKDDLKIVAEKEKVANGSWQWRLPPHTPKRWIED